MNSNQDSLHTLNEIRDLMERSSKFLSLSGLSGVFAGIFALAGAGIAYVRFKTDIFDQILTPLGVYTGQAREPISTFLLLDGLCVLILSLATGIFLTLRKARKRGVTVWNGSSKRLLVGMLVPLATGGIFCLAMLHYGFIWLVFPVTLIFYGLALVNASKVTYPDLFYLGLSEIGIGCLALFLTGYSLLFWSIGFGILHIIYGLTMYQKYDRDVPKSGDRLMKSMLVLLLLLPALGSNAQVPADSTAARARRWYDAETIYLRGGNSYVKNNIVFSGQKALQREFSFSEGGLQLYKKSRRTRGIGVVISLAGSAGTIASLISGNRDNLKKFFWVSIGTGLVSSVLTVNANNLRDQAVWLRNRDALLFLEANR